MKPLITLKQMCIPALLLASLAALTATDASAMGKRHRSRRVTVEHVVPSRSAIYAKLKELFSQAHAPKREALELGQSWTCTEYEGSLYESKTATSVRDYRDYEMTMYRYSPTVTRTQGVEAFKFSDSLPGVFENSVDERSYLFSNGELKSTVANEVTSIRMMEQGYLIAEIRAYGGLEEGEVASAIDPQATAIVYLICKTGTGLEDLL